MAGGLLVVLGSPSLASADDELTTHLIERYGRVEDAAPALTFDPLRAPAIETVGTEETIHETQTRLLGTRVSLRGVERRNERDTFTRGYLASITLSRDLGFAWLTVGAAAGQLQSTNMLATVDGPVRFGAASYVQLGAALTRTFKISRWNTAWISLSLTRRQWLGEHPAPGEQEGTQLMLSVGTTFK